MDRLEAMTVFVATVDGGSLSAAGRQLGMPLATVSRKLSELEAHLRARLLIRSTRALTLTDAGRDYLTSCRRVLEELGEAERRAAGEYSEPRGELAITAPLVFGRMHVLPVVAEFLRAYPQVSVRLLQGDRVVNLGEEPVDLAARIGPVPDSRLVATAVGATRRVVCASPAYLAEHGRPVTPDDLVRHACISFDALDGPDRWHFQPAGGGDLRVAVHPRLTVNTAEAAVEAAVAGVGLTRVLCYQAMAAFRDGRLQAVLDAYESAPVPISLLFDAQRRLPLKLRAFVDFATPRLRARLAPTG